MSDLLPVAAILEYNTRNGVLATDGTIDLPSRSDCSTTQAFSGADTSSAATARASIL
jgi:hypothetical protein